VEGHGILLVGRGCIVPHLRRSGRREPIGQTRAVLVRRAALAVLVLAAACSSGTQGDGSLASTIALRLRADPDEGELTFDPDEARCVADRVVDRLGEARLVDLGAERDALDVLPFDETERVVVFAAVDACADLEAQIATFLARDEALPDAVARCMAERYVAAPELRDALFGPEVPPALATRIDEVLDDAFAACSAGPG
jgi:hypothetical protein